MASLYQNNPYAIQAPQQQQQSQINPLQGLQMYQQFSGGGTGGLSGLLGGGAEAGAGSLTAAEGTATGAAGAEGAGSALMSNPIGWIAAAALAQNVAHNKGISSWGDAMRGTSAREAGDHFMNQWGVDDDSKLKDVAGLAGWGSGGGILNPGNLNKKIFG